MDNTDFEHLFSRPERQATSGGQASMQKLQQRLDKLEMVCEALWRLLRDQSGLSDEALLKMVAEVDLEDGRYDGKKSSKSFRVCPKCGRTNSKDHPNCIYCGEIILIEPFG